MRSRAAPIAFAVVALALLLAALAQAQRSTRQVELRDTHYVFGTLLEVVAVTPSGQSAQKTRIGMAALGPALRGMHRDWHAWLPGALTDLNAALARGQTEQVPPDLARLLVQGQRLACQSGGLFEPALGGLVALWGFHADTPPEGAPPTPAAIAALQARASRMSDLVFEGDRIGSRNRAVQLDLGGYAKGAALMQAGDLLKAHGIRSAVLNAGGDVQVIGQPGARPWRVAIRDPFLWGAVAAVDLMAGEGLYTSGNYERFLEQDGTRFAHILDPRTGMPIQEIVSASVLHPDGARADAAATALSVAGADGWAQTAADMEITQALLITQDGRLLATPEMAERLTWTDAVFKTQMEVVPLPAPRDLSCAAVPFHTMSAM